MNRRGLETYLTRLIASGTDFALLHADLDWFKEVNDTLGHDAGDYVLQHVAQIMGEETRGRDCVARIGGDEFVLIIQGAGSAQVAAIASRLIQRVRQPMPFNGKTCAVSLSIGAVLSRDYETPEIGTLLKDADRALYASKDAGRSTYRLFDPRLDRVITPS